MLLEIYDGPHYPTQPEWYSSTDDARLGTLRNRLAVTNLASTVPA